MSNKVLVTGAGSGFGRGVAIELARKGYEVIASTETNDQKRALELDIKDEDFPLTVKKLDITDENDRKSAEDWDIDILVNNAATAESGPLAEIPMEYLRSNFEVNVFGTIALTQDVVKGMLKRGHGKVIIISSVAGRMTAPYLGPYCMTKHALEAAADVLREELKPHNIQVSVIEPGPYATGFNERMNESKYKWYGENSIFATDNKTVQELEAWLVSEQFDPSEVVDVIVDVVKSANPKFRTCIPKVWEETVKGVLCGEN